MPLLFYGRIKSSQVEPYLYSADLRKIEVKLWKSYTQLGRLVPKKRKLHVARLWWWEEQDHTVLAWPEEGYDQAIFIPRLLKHRAALMIARDTWPTIIPSPITFRIKESTWQIE